VLPDEAEYHNEILKLVKKLPSAHKSLLLRLLEFLAEVAEHSDKNKMTISNLATIISPCILYSETSEEAMKLVSNITRATAVVQFMIENHAEFQKDLPEESSSSSSDVSIIRKISR
jgi:hypothetical protein